MEIDIIETGNSRLLYQEHFGLPYNLFHIVGRIERYIKASPNFQFENKMNWIYFFTPSSCDEIFESDVWVGREVIAPVISTNDEGLNLLDLDAGKCFEHKVKDRDLSFCDIFSIEQQMRSSLIEKNQYLKLAQTWKVGVSDDWLLCSESGQYIHINLFEDDE